MQSRDTAVTVALMQNEPRRVIATMVKIVDAFDILTHDKYRVNYLTRHGARILKVYQGGRDTPLPMKIDDKWMPNCYLGTSTGRYTWCCWHTVGPRKRHSFTKC